MQLHLKYSSSSSSSPSSSLSLPRASPARDLPASVVVNAPLESIDRYARAVCTHVIVRKSQWLEVLTEFDNALIVECFTTYLTENIVYTALCRMVMS